MGVYKREYCREGRTVWGYAFVYGKQRYRKAGHATKAEAELAEEQVRKSVILERKRASPLIPIRFDALVALFFENRGAERAATTVDGEQNKSRILLRHFKSR